MTDWADGIETRNYGIQRCMDRYTFYDLMLMVSSLALVAAVLVFHSWVRNQIIAIGYESQNLFAEEESLLRIQKRLILEEETLRNPERIDAVAQNDLGMAPLRPSQMVMPQLQDMDRSLSGVLALAHSQATVVKKPASAKRSASYTN